MTLGNNQLRIVSQCEISRPMTHKFINHDECDKSLTCHGLGMKEWLAAFRDLDMAPAPLRSGCGLATDGESVR